LSFLSYLRIIIILMRQEIIEKARKMFFQKGVRSVTLDDLCNEMGISKKTIYQYFSNKEELIDEAVTSYMMINIGQIEDFMTHSENAIEGFFRTANHVYHIFNSISPTTIHETKKYYPQIWTKLQLFKKASIEKLTVVNLQNGIQEGLYRDDINADMVMRFYLTIVLNMNDEELFPDTLYHPGKVYRDYIKYHIRSIATEKGYELFKQLSQSEPFHQASNQSK